MFYFPVGQRQQREPCVHGLVRCGGIPCGPGGRIGVALRHVRELFAQVQHGGGRDGCAGCEDFRVQFRYRDRSADGQLEDLHCQQCNGSEAAASVGIVVTFEVLT